MRDFEEFSFNFPAIEAPPVPGLLSELPSDSLKLENVLASLIHHQIFSDQHKLSPQLPDGLTEDLVEEFLKEVIKGNMAKIRQSDESKLEHVQKRMDAFLKKNQGTIKHASDEITSFLQSKGLECIAPTYIPRVYSKEVDNDTVAVMLCNNTCYIAANVKVREEIRKKVKYFDNGIGLNLKIAKKMARIAYEFFKKECLTNPTAIPPIIILSPQTMPTTKEENAECHAEMQCVAQFKKLLTQTRTTAELKAKLGVSRACCQKCLGELKKESNIFYPNLTLEPPDKKHPAFISTPAKLNDKDINWLPPEEIKVKEMYTYPEFSPVKASKKSKSTHVAEITVPQAFSTNSTQGGVSKKRKSVSQAGNPSRLFSTPQKKHSPSNPTIPSTGPRSSTFQ